MTLSDPPRQFSKRVMALAQTRQSQLGASHAARPSARDRIRTTSQNVAAHAGNVCFLRRAAPVVLAEQESVLHSRMAAGEVAHRRRSIHQRRCLEHPIDTHNQVKECYRLGYVNHPESSPSVAFPLRVISGLPVIQEFLRSIYTSRPPVTHSIWKDYECKNPNMP
jgi:hypothetical protein